MTKDTKIEIAIFISFIIFTLVWLNSCDNFIKEKQYSKSEFDALIMNDSSVVRYTIGDPSDSIYFYGKRDISDGVEWSVGFEPVKKEKDTVIVWGEISIKWVPIINDSFEVKFGDYLEDVYLITKTDTFIFSYSCRRKIK